MIIRWFGVAAVAVFVYLCAGASAAPGLMNYSGRLLDASQLPVTAPAEVRFSFWDAPAGGAQLGGGYEYEVTISPDSEGLYSVAIGDESAGMGGPVPAEVFNAPAVWLNVNIGGEDLSPRARMATVSYAFRADQATTASIAQNALGLTGTSFVMAQSTGTEIQNGKALLAAYQQAKALRPHGRDLSADNRAALVVPPGRYDLTTHSLILDAEFVDVIGLTSNRESQHIFGTANGVDTGVLQQAVHDVRIENLTVEILPVIGIIPINSTTPAAYFPETNGSATVMTNCWLRMPVFSIAPCSTRLAVEYAGTYVDCLGGYGSFGGYGGTASGVFIRCSAGIDGFGGGSNGVASGTFIDCTGDYDSFGRTASGTFTNCAGGTSSFGGSGTASGIFTRCTGGVRAFGGGGIASGTFTQCQGGVESFGGGNGAATGGKFAYCQGGADSFGTGADKVGHCLREGVPVP